MKKILSAVLVKKTLTRLADPIKAANLQRFFKTAKGQYGYGDVFLGITVPAQRSVAKTFKDLPLPHIHTLLISPIHEHRFTGLEILVMQYEKGDAALQKAIFDFYLKHTKCVNNWDLVDTSAPYIAGEHLKNKSRQALYKLAKSKNVWERRIAIVSTYAFIKHGDVSDTLYISTLLLKDTHDLIHKACGWMLREAGKLDRQVLLRFLDTHAAHMPRTMLRYSLEHLSKEKRMHYLKQR